jgi:hypothetical protein
VSSLALRPLYRTDVKVGLPLPWPVYNDKRQLLLRAGFVIESANQLDLLLGNGLFRPREVRGADPFVTEPDVRSQDAAATAASALPEAQPPAETISMSFADMGLQPGTTILMTSEHANAECRYVRLVGFVDRKALIVSHPENEGQLVFVKDGTIFHCKGFHGKRAFHFHATAMHSQLQPYPYLHMTYPEKVGTMAVRSSHRIKTNVIASVHFEGAAEGCPATIRDLGLNGAQVHLPRMKCPPGTPVQLAFRLTIDNEKLLFEIPSVVKRSQPIVSEAGYASQELGVQFIDLAIEKRRMLEIHVNRNLLAIVDPAA